MTTETDYAAPIDDAAREWVRLRFTFDRGEVTSFLVQYETTYLGRRVPVVRYDGVHGFAHRDILDRRGKVTKEPLSGNPSYREALEIGRRDILENWQTYLVNFLEEES